MTKGMHCSTAALCPLPKGTLVHDTALLRKQDYHSCICTWSPHGPYSLAPQSASCDDIGGCAKYAAWHLFLDRRAHPLTTNMLGLV
jgi:hypothetical protein